MTAPICKTEGCGGLLPPRTGKQGRPRVYCYDCKPLKGAEEITTVRNYKKGSKDGPDANIKQRTFNKTSKRTHQGIQYTDDWAMAGIDKISAGRKIAILGDLQNGNGDQIQLLIQLGKIEGDSQVLSFCDDDIIEGKNIGGLAKNKKNRKLYPNGTFIFGNMIDYVSLINETCDVVDYDACSALMPTSRATKELPKLLTKLTVPVFQINVLVEGWGTNGYRSTYDDMAMFQQMPGFEDWDYVWARPYQSISDDGKGQTWTYRTYTFVRR